MHLRTPLAFLGTRAHSWLVGNLVALHRAASQQMNSKPILVHGVILPQGQDPVLALVELHQVPLRQLSRLSRSC